MKGLYFIQSLRWRHELFIDRGHHFQQDFRRLWFQPLPAVGIGQDNRHAIMIFGKQAVGFRGDDRTAFDLFAFRIFPNFP